ncbi:MAG: SDR family oxidoreductase [Bacteroidia bacterium]
METNYNNKVVWITGASSGIGEALAYSLNSKGAFLIISGRNIENLEKVKGNCSYPDNVEVLALDLEQPGTLAAKTEQALKLYGRVDFMMHNAGVALRDRVIHTSMEMDRKIMQVNYFAPIEITKALLPSMIKNKSGNIAVVSSISGKFGVPKLSAYSASKHALHGFFESLRSEVHKHNVHVTIITPGFIKTDITVNAYTGHGGNYGKMVNANKNGMSPERCAEKMAKAMLNNTQEAYIGGIDILSIYAKRFFPELFSVVIRSSPIRKMEAIKQFIKKLIFIPSLKLQPVSR